MKTNHRKQAYYQSHNQALDNSIIKLLFKNVIRSPS